MYKQPGKNSKDSKRVLIHFDYFKATLKKYQIGKCQAIMAYVIPGLENSLPSRQTDYQNK